MKMLTDAGFASAIISRYIVITAQGLPGASIVYLDLLPAEQGGGDIYQSVRCVLNLLLELHQHSHNAQILREETMERQALARHYQAEMALLRMQDRTIYTNIETLRRELRAIETAPVKGAGKRRAARERVRRSRHDALIKQLRRYVEAVNEPQIPDAAALRASLEALARQAAPGGAQTILSGRTALEILEQAAQREADSRASSPNAGLFRIVPVDTAARVTGPFHSSAGEMPERRAFGPVVHRQSQLFGGAPMAFALPSQAEQGSGGSEAEAAPCIVLPRPDLRLLAPRAEAADSDRAATGHLYPGGPMTHTAMTRPVPGPDGQAFEIDGRPGNAATGPRTQADLPGRLDEALRFGGLRQLIPQVYRHEVLGAAEKPGESVYSHTHIKHIINLKTTVGGDHAALMTSINGGMKGFLAAPGRFLPPAAAAAFSATRLMTPIALLRARGDEYDSRTAGDRMASPGDPGTGRKSIRMPAAGYLHSSAVRSEHVYLSPRLRDMARTGQSGRPADMTGYPGTTPDGYTLSGLARRFDARGGRGQAGLDTASYFSEAAPVNRMEGERTSLVWGMLPARKAGDNATAAGTPHAQGFADRDAVTFASPVAFMRLQALAVATPNALRPARNAALNDRGGLGNAEFAGITAGQRMTLPNNRTAPMTVVHHSPEGAADAGSSPIDRSFMQFISFAPVLNTYLASGRGGESRGGPMQNPLARTGESTADLGPGNRFFITHRQTAHSPPEGSDFARLYHPASGLRTSARVLGGDAVPAVAVGQSAAADMAGLAGYVSADSDRRTHRAPAPSFREEATMVHADRQPQGRPHEPGTWQIVDELRSSIELHQQAIDRLQANRGRDGIAPSDIKAITRDVIANMDKQLRLERQRRGLL